MIKIENTEVVGWAPTIRGMRNPKNSWGRSDSRVFYKTPEGFETVPNDLNDEYAYAIGPNDLKLMQDLANGGPVHAKYRRMIVVYVDITAPLYWWKEFDTYKVGTVANSCSTMHKIHEKEFALDDFSHEHLMDKGEIDTDNKIPSKYVLCSNGVGPTQGFNTSSLGALQIIIDALNFYREAYARHPEESIKKSYWWQMIQLLPSSYNQKRTVMLNYEVLANMYESREFHKLDEWRELCRWIVGLPCSSIITGRLPIIPFKPTDTKGK